MIHIVKITLHYITLHQ